jgi:hypothetical protein
MAGGSLAISVTVVTAYFLRLQTSVIRRSRHLDITSHMIAMIIWRSSVGIILRRDRITGSVNYFFHECRGLLASIHFRFWGGTGVPIGNALPVRRRWRSGKRPLKFGRLICCQFFYVGPCLSHLPLCHSNYGFISRPRSHLCPSPFVLPEDTPVLFCAAAPRLRARGIQCPT